MQEYLSRAQPNCESFLWVLDASSWHNLELMNENGGHERGRDLEQEDVVVPPSAHHPCHSPEVMQVMYLPEESWSDALMCDISLETSADGRDGGQFPAYPRFSEADYHEEGMFRSPLVWVEQQSLIADHLLQGNARKSVHMEKIARFMEEVVCSLQDVVQELTRADADKDGIRAFWESITLMKCKNSPAKNG